MTMARGTLWILTVLAGVIASAGAEEPSATAISGTALIGNALTDHARQQAFEQQSYAGLARTTNCSFDEAPLVGVIAFFSGATGMQFTIDHKGLQEAGIASDTPVSISMQGIAVRSALDAMLEQLDLTWIIQHESVVITTTARAECVLDTRVYPVLDLVRAADDHGEFLDFESLLDLITATVAPTTWSEVGGSGSLRPFYNTGSLVVTQTRRVQEETALLLTKLRATRRGAASGPKLIGEASQSHGASSADVPVPMTRYPSPSTLPSLRWQISQTYE